jgi:hypothetical protein
MSISYSAVVGAKHKVTLPSVDSWGTNMNILRDPPKSITTRRIDKVGDTSEITQMVQESGDRANEAIRVYALGANPMTSVSYNNYGNGSQTAGSAQAGRQAFLPYRIMDKGAFRPPIRDQRDLLPLSRLPRVWTSSFTKPGFADFSKKAVCPGADAQGVKKASEMLKACVRPTATYNVQTPIVENYEVKHVIKNPVMVSGHSRVSIPAKFNAENSNPTAQIEYRIKPDYNVNISSNITREVDISDFNTEKYTHEKLYGEYEANKNRNIQISSIEDLYGVDTDVATRDAFVIDYTAPQSGYTRNDYIHDEIELERALPYHDASTNMGQSVYKHFEHVNEREYVSNHPTTSAMINAGRYGGDIMENNDRDYRLKPTVYAGGFEGVPNLPTLLQENQMPEFDQHKSMMRQRIYEMQQERNSVPVYN